MSAAPVAIPARTKRPKWAQGDIVTINGTRWKIRGILPGGRAELECMSDPTARGMWWSTTLDRLPEKTS